MKKNSIKKNAILNTLFTTSNMLFTLITYPYITRVLLVEGTGKVSFFNALSAYAVMISALGINTYGIRATSVVRDDKQKLSEVTAQLFLINLIMTFIVIGCLIASIPLVGKFQNDTNLLLINCIYILAETIGMQWLFSGLEQYDYIVKRTLAFRTLSLVLVFMLVKGPEDYIKYAAISTFTNVAAYMLNFIYAKKFISFRLVKSWEFKVHLKPMLFLFASTCAINVYTNLDTVMLGFVSGDLETGFYTLAVKIKSVLIMGINSISAVLLPRLSYYIGQKKLDEYERVLRKSISIILMIAIPMAVFFACEADDSICLLGGSSYLPATACMRIIMPILVLSSLSNITGNQVLIPLKKDKLYMLAVVIGALTDVVLNFALMPRWGCNGAAVATLVAELVQLLVQFLYAKDQILESIQLKPILKIVVSVLVAAGLIIIFRMMIALNYFVRLVVTAAIFWGTYAVMLLILKETYFIDILGDVLKIRKGHAV